MDRKSILPLYYQIEQELLKRINEGDYKAGDLLPTEKELQTQYDVSRTTIRSALSSLMQKGLIIRIPGKGTFIAKPRIIHHVGTITSFTDEMKRRGIKPSTKLLFFTRITTPEYIAKDLNIPIDSKVIMMRRLRFANGEPIAVNDTYLPEDMVPELLEKGLKGESLYNMLETEYGWQFKETRETIEATLIVDQEAILLGVPNGSPGLLVGRVSFVQNGRPVERAYTTYRGDRFTYFTTLYGRNEEIKNQYI